MTRRNTAIVAATVLVLVLGWYALLWSPKGADLASAKERRTTAEARVEELEGRLADLRAAAKDEVHLREASDRLAAAVPAEADLDSFVLQVNEAARAVGIDFVSVVPSEPTAATPGGPTAIVVALDAKGDYLRMLDFLDRLAAMPRLLVVDTVAVNKVATASDVSVSLTGRTFTTLVPGAAAPTTPAATAAPTDSADTIDLG